jgi:hypothetical protein
MKGNPVKFTLKIETGSAAMQTGEDIADALRTLAKKASFRDMTPGDVGVVRDINGNTIGEWQAS